MWPPFLPVLALALSACWDNPLAKVAPPDEAALLAEARGEHPLGPVGPLMGTWSWEPEVPDAAWLAAHPDHAADARFQAWQLERDAVTLQLDATTLTVTRRAASGSTTPHTASWTLKDRGVDDAGLTVLKLDTVTAAGEARSVVIRVLDADHVEVGSPGKPGQRFTRS